MGIYRILVVDDDEDYLEPVQAALEDAGYQVVTARDGWDGIARARSSRPDLILLDVRMPQLDGWTFLKIIRSNRELAAVPVIYLTGLASAEDEERGYRLGASSFLTKVLSFDPLLLKVAAALDRQAGLPGRSAPERRTAPPAVRAGGWTRWGSPRFYRFWVREGGRAYLSSLPAAAERAIFGRRKTGQWRRK